MPSPQRRLAIAQLASLEQIAATILLAQVNTPEVRAAVEWVESRLAEIEPFFLRHSDELSDPWRDRYLNAAERWLTFYVSELRRLEDLAGVPMDTATWTRH